MFLSLIFSYYNSEKNRLPALWQFYKLVDTYSCDEIVFITDSEDYFLDPLNLSEEYYHGIGEKEQKIYGYTLPSIEKLNKYKRVVFDKYKCDDRERLNILNEYKGFEFVENDIEVNLFINLNTSYLLLKKSGFIPTVVICHGDKDYIKVFCEKNVLLYISLELGPFRTQVMNNSLFAIGGIYDREIIEMRYGKFKKELINDPVPIYRKNEIFSIFFDKKRIDEVNNSFPQYSLGVAFPYSFGPKRKGFDILLNLAKTYPGSLICRFHPTDINKVEINNIVIDKSPNSFDFINKCKRIISYSSNISIEAILLDKIVFDLGSAPFSWLANNDFSTTIEKNCSLLKFNFFIFAFITPYEFCYNKEYINWRLTNPSETEIYLKNINYWKKHFN